MTSIDLLKPIQFWRRLFGYMTATMELSGTLPLSVFTSTDCELGSMVTVDTLLMTSGSTCWLEPLTLALTAMVYWPAGAAAPVLVVPFQENGVSPESFGVSLNELTGLPLESVIDTVSCDAPCGAVTAPAIVPPAARVAVAPGARTECPSRVVPFMICEAGSELCML